MDNTRRYIIIIVIIKARSLNQARLLPVLFFRVTHLFSYVPCKCRELSRDLEPSAALAGSVKRLDQHYPGSRNRGREPAERPRSPGLSSECHCSMQPTIMLNYIKVAGEGTILESLTWPFLQLPGTDPASRGTRLSST